MAIPEAQLDTWSGQGAIAGSRDTYATVKLALEANDTDYARKQYEVFLQGSYGNDTNIYAESDVDIVICLNTVFYHDLTLISPLEQAVFKSAFPDGTDTLADFKAGVLKALRKRFGNTVKPDPKAIKIPAEGARRNADVIVAADFRRYRRFISTVDNKYDEGICFWNNKGERIANYPKYHSKNCTAKHQATKNWFKPTVRIFKNMRQRLVNNNIIDKSIAPSYFIEGLLYNVPDNLFGTSYELTFLQSLNWLLSNDRTKLVCANYQYYLLGKSNEQWPATNCDTFLTQILKLWQEWKT
jgi:hypothetical protein